MPKPYTFPTLYNEALQICISKLKEWGYLNPDQNKGGLLIWSLNGTKTGRISIRVNTKGKSPHISLNYKYGKVPRSYKLKFVFTQSNLGKGKIWYFLCPQTNKRCRKLYLVDGYFLHREAFNDCMYESQTKSKKYRRMEKILNTYFNTDELYSQLYQKHFKMAYAGKPTKRYLKIMEQINKAEHISQQEIELLESI